jgi:PAS domain S-box-containing protein
MSTASPNSKHEDAGVRITLALRAEQLRLYDANLLSSVAGNLLVAALLVAVQWGSVTTERLLGWGACMGLILSARVLNWYAHRHRQAQGSDGQAQLLRFRLGVAGTGLVWGLAGVVLFAAQDLQHQVFLAFVLAGIAAGSLTLTSFDLAAALSFAVLTLAPLSVRLFASAESAQGAMAAMVLLFMAFLALTALRAYRNVRETVVLRGAESARADTLLRSQRRLQELSDQLTRKTQALELTLDSMEQGILSIDSDGRTSVHNRRLVELTDLPESFLAARPTMDEIAHYQSEHGHYGEGLGLVDGSARTHLARWLDGDRQPFPEIYFRKTLSGRMLEVKTRHLPAGGLVRTFSDVTAYFEAQEKLGASEAQARKLALVAAHTDNAVLIVDAARRIEWVNEGFTRLTGYPLEDVAGRTAGDVLRGPDTDLAEVARLDEQLQRENRASGELVHYAKNGQPYWVAVDSHAILDRSGQIERYVSIARDITATKRAAEALLTARDEAERANRSKSEFLSAMSHELRTPMNAILGFGQLLESDPGCGLPEGQRSFVREILRAGEHLLELINDVLDLARVEAGKQQISLEPVQVSTLLDDCLSLMQPVARMRGIGLPDAARVDCGVFVTADRTRLKQVLLNLLSNAIKYNRPDGRVDITCKADGDALRISVSDTGQGLSPEQCERLFNAFERLGAESGAIEGAGIGLVLSKRLVELMHGSIGLDSVLDQGSTFWVRLASAQPPRNGDTHSVGATRAVTATPIVEGSCTVLYIEDNPVNVLLMEAMVTRAPGVRLITAPLPEVGLEMAHAAQPDLILLDIQLPGMDGYEVLRRLRAHESTRTIRVIAISANAMSGDIEQGLVAGFDDYLTKPLDMSRLLGVLRSALRHRSAAEVLHET